MGCRTPGQREASLNIIEVKPVRLPLLFDLVNKFLAKFGVRHGIRRSYDQVSLAARGHQSRLPAAMSVRVVEILDWHARHQKIFQNTVFDRFHANRGNAFIVEIVRPRKFYAVEFLLCWIVDYAQERRQNQLIYLFRKRLAFRFIFLTMPFEPVPQNFVEENGRSPAGKHGRAGVRLSHWSCAQRLQVFRNFVHFRGEFGIRRELIGSWCLKRFHAHQFHSVVRARLALHQQPAARSGPHHRSAVTRGEIRTIVAHLK